MLLPYFVAVVIAFVMSTVVTVIVVSRFAKRAPMRMRDIHTRPITRFGGLAVLSAFIIAVLLHADLVITQDILALLLGMILVTVGGFIDDRKEKSAAMQAGVQSVGVLLFLLLGGISITGINNPFGGAWEVSALVGAVIAGAWMLAVMNVMNWLDGLDGLGSVVLLIGFVVLAIVGGLPHVHQPPLVIIALAAAGAVGAFLIFNAPPALVFLGTGGVLGASFLLGGISVMAGGKMATAAIVLGIPLLDAAWVLWQRFQSRHPLTKGDTRHLHHALLEAGYSRSHILILYAAATIVFAIVALTLTGPWRLLAGIVVASIFYIVVRHVRLANRLRAS